MDQRIREITLDDLEEIQRLTAQLGYAPDAAELRTSLEHILKQDDHVALAFVSENRVLGWIHAFQTWRIESGSFVEIGGLVVDESQRRKGIGKQLIDAVSHWTRNRGQQKLRVRTNRTRVETHRFYERYGFSETKEQKVYQIRFD